MVHYIYIFSEQYLLSFVAEFRGEITTVIPSLIEQLEYQDYNVQSTTAATLGKLADYGEQLLDAIKAFLTLIYSRVT